MSTSSTNSQKIHRRIEVLQNTVRPPRLSSRPSTGIVTRKGAYTFAIRTAYLHHLLQPKLRRLQHVAAPNKPPLQKPSSSVADLLKDFSLVRDTKSARFPHGFTAELDKRISGLLVGKEKLPEFNDPVIKRTFAAFLNEFKKPGFRKGAEKDRRVEDLILIFFSNATKELAKGKAPDDDTWKLMVDRHVALFVRLIAATLKHNGWLKDRPELDARLSTLENKLLLHDQDLSVASQRNGGAGGTSQEVEVPRSGDVKDMQLVQVVAGIFEKSWAQTQTDIDDMKDFWTEKAALHDLKMYQTNLSLNSKKTLRSDDFDTEEAYEHWKKSEISDLSKMMLSIIHSSPGLAQSAPADVAHLKRTATTSSNSSYSDLNSNKRLSDIENDSGYTFDQPVDMSALNLGYESGPETEPEDPMPYTFIPQDSRATYRITLQAALTHDLQAQSASRTNGSDIGSEMVLSKRSLELLHELGRRWRLPQISRLMLFLDIARERYLNSEIDVNVLDAAFNLFKNPPADKHVPDWTIVFDRTRWTIKDYVLNQQIKSSIHDALLRDLFGELMHCYDQKAPEIGPMMAILEDDIYEDPNFTKPKETLSRFSSQLKESLIEKANEIYIELAGEQMHGYREQVEFYHVIQLGKTVLKLANKIQKRYCKAPEIMGVSPFPILVEVMLPTYVQDARDHLSMILHQAQLKGEEIAIQDGFEVYREMVEIRRVHDQALPNVKFAFNIEALLETFVWRWISMTENSIFGWVEGAVQQDPFRVRNENSDEASTPSEGDRHSVSVVDIFHSFNQSLDQILQSQWADQYQFATFMTALAKAFGRGVGRYCELVEKIFVKEMDRLTPEREAELTKSKQEKWMQMAKDTFSQREKIEPFQFFPESFVKLNNIGYAMLQLDLLEQKMDVDKCAELVRLRRPQQQDRRRQENLVFTIKIIEAEDLKSADVNGLSDPYVVLGDENQKRLAKTRIIYGSLNPRWEETIDLITQGPRNVVATVWDWDYLGDHECLGRTFLKLDPLHFRDFLPREYWLDLDTQGRLLVRVSMEGEKDDIQFYFGRAFRVLKRTERDMTRKITDKLSASIQHTLSRRTLKSMTSRGISISSVSKYFNRGSGSLPPTNPTPISTTEVAAILEPLFTYFNENFAVMKQTLATPAMIMVMTRLWKEVLTTIESLLVPQLSDKPSLQRQLSDQELDIVFKWLSMLFDFFHAADEDDPTVVYGVPLDILKSPKYHDLQNLNFFYFEPTSALIRISERMAAATADRHSELQHRLNRLSAPASLLQPPSGGSVRFASMRVASAMRPKSIMLNRNLGTMRKAKEEKRKDLQAEPSDDVVLRILRMRPEAAKYLKERARQKERLAASAAAEMIVRQSLLGAGVGAKAGFPGR